MPQELPGYFIADQAIAVIGRRLYPNDWPGTIAKNYQEAPRSQANSREVSATLKRRALQIESAGGDSKAWLAQQMAPDTGPKDFTMDWGEHKKWIDARDKLQGWLAVGVMIGKIVTDRGEMKNLPENVWREKEGSVGREALNKGRMENHMFDGLTTYSGFPYFSVAALEETLTNELGRTKSSTPEPAKSPNPVTLDHNANPATSEKDSRSERSRKGGKKKGDGSFDSIDSPLVEKMRELIKNGDATDPTKAARIVIKTTEGKKAIKQSDIATVVRLRKKYYQLYPR